MGREFASAAARWCHLLDMKVKPEIVAVCDYAEEPRNWFTNHFDTIKQSTGDYKELLANPDVDAVYCAVPHNMHEQVYGDIIKAGKHLFGEKPFGIDLPANQAIVKLAEENPKVLVRCCSQFPYFPAVQKIGEMIESNAFGTLLEVDAAFLHSSDLNPDKPINWKRKVDMNGIYGVMGDLGMHVCHVPFRAGWTPKNVRAILSNVVKDRPDGSGKRVPCETWDNATMLCEAEDPRNGGAFPLTLKTQRIAPGESNSWNLEIRGMKACARFSTRQPNTLWVLEYNGGAQEWREISVGYTPLFPSITGGIFEFGFTDAILQMWAAFLIEVTGGELPKSLLAQAATPEEANLSHKLFTAALKSAEKGETCSVS